MTSVVLPTENRGLFLADAFVEDVSQLSVSAMPMPRMWDDAVLVRVEAIGVNFFDILMVTGKYQFKPSFPFAPGSEYAGIVVQIGDEVTDFKVGDRVCGHVMHGAYAEYISATQFSLHHLPDNITLDQGAALLSTYATSYGALNHRIKVQPGEFVLVHGAAGGVGLAACQIAKALGGIVIAACSSESKCRVVKELGGADYAINTSTEDWIERVKEITDDHGADVVYDPVGLVFESTKCVAWNGKILVIGFAGGKIPTIAVNRCLLKNCAVIGFMYGGMAIHEGPALPPLFDGLFDLLRKGAIKPVVSSPIYYGLESSVQALQDVANRKTFGKPVIRPHSKAPSKM